MKNIVLLWSTSVEKKDSSIAPFNLFSFFLGLLFFWPFSFFSSGVSSRLVGESWSPSSFPHWDNALIMMIITLLFFLQLNNYNSKLEQDMTLYECLRRCTGMGNDSRVTCKKICMVALPHIRCQLHDHARQYDNDEACHKNGMVESCMAIYLGMAVEMP